MMTLAGARAKRLAGDCRLERRVRRHRSHARLLETLRRPEAQYHQFTGVDPVVHVVVDTVNVDTTHTSETSIHYSLPDAWLDNKYLQRALEILVNGVRSG